MKKVEEQNIVETGQVIYKNAETIRDEFLDLLLQYKRFLIEKCSDASLSFILENHSDLKNRYETEAYNFKAKIEAIDVIITKTQEISLI